jgi:deoxyribodipyrimidine photo-lyase
MSKGLCWIRRDIRLHDHAALSHCADQNTQVYLAFIFDNDILDPLKKRAPGDRRIQFIVESLAEIQAQLKQYNATLIIRYGNPVDIIPTLVKDFEIDNLYFNRDYSPYAQKRDAAVTQHVVDMGKQVHTFKDCVIFEPTEVLNATQQPYKVFTPYSTAWKLKLESLLPLPTFSVRQDRFAPLPNEPHLDTEEKLLHFAGFAPEPLILKGGTRQGLNRLADFAQKMSNYDHDRDYPAIDGTSLLSVYLRHGCISVREMVACALSQDNIGAQKWLNELVWREFYQVIFYYFPQVNTMPFQQKFNSLVFPTSEEYLAKFKAGQTGFPIIDAAMRCLNQTGCMHNRLRMVTASFLTKILLVDWKRGERYFSWKLLDYELQSNNGGWQWSAGIGCDAAPYFRIFNPTTQSKTYDPDGKFIRQFCPELKDLNNKDIHNPIDAKSLPLSFQLGRDYPFPIVDYKINRKKALDLYHSAANEEKNAKTI